LTRPPDAPKFKLGKTAPLLSLNLDDSKETGEKDSTFDAILRHGTAPAIKEVLDWKTLDAKQLSIEETLALVEGCSQSVKARGESLERKNHVYSKALN
jgi:hypothetical protein